MVEQTPQRKVIRMHDAHFRQLRRGDEWGIAFDLGLAVGEQVIITPFTKSGHIEIDANAVVIESPDGIGTALRVESIIQPMRMGGKRWPGAQELLTIECDGTAH